MKIRHIFLSRGTPFTPQQEAFIDRLKQLLRARGWEPIIIGDTVEGIRSAVEQAREEMAVCSGAIVVAFKRIKISSGTDLKSSKPTDGWELPTVWNHLEAAIAYTHHLPLFVLAEEGIHREGMLSKRIEWDAMEIVPDVALFESDRFLKRLNDWFRFVERTDARPRIDPSKLSIFELAGSLTPKQRWTACASLLGLLLAVFVFGYKIGGVLQQRDANQATQPTSISTPR